MSVHDVRVALTPPEELRRAWKLKRDCTRRGYTTDEVLAEHTDPDTGEREIMGVSRLSRRGATSVPQRVEHLLLREQVVPGAPKDVFEFYADAANLERITQAFEDL